MEFSRGELQWFQVAPVRRLQQQMVTGGKVSNAAAGQQNSREAG
jgi:hypothetical protein